MELQFVQKTLQTLSVRDIRYPYTYSAPLQPSDTRHPQSVPLNSLLMQDAINIQAKWVKVPKGQPAAPYPLDIPPTITVQQLKERISQLFQTDPSLLRLLLSGKVLQQPDTMPFDAVDGSPLSPVVLHFMLKK